MPNLTEENRKNKYYTRSQTYVIQRITEPVDLTDRHYRSIRKMANELNISEFKIREFIKTREESKYVRSKDNVLFLLKKPIKDVAITARCIEDYENQYAYQEFTSIYQLSKRFRLSFETIYERKHMQPLNVECNKPVFDEFKRKYLLTFYK